MCPATCYLLPAQAQQIDSLKTVLKTAKEDTNKVNVLNALSKKQWIAGNYDSSLFYAKQALFLSDSVLKKDGLNGAATAHNNMGVCFYYLGNYPEALKNYFAALKIKEKLNDKKGIASSYGNIGMVYYNQENYSEALKNNFACLKVMQETHDKKGIETCYNNIGLNYSEQKKYKEALENYANSLKIMTEIGEKSGMARAYNNIGVLNNQQGNYTEAIKNYFIALDLRKETKDKRGIIICYNNLGGVFLKQKKNKEGKEWLQKGIELAKQLKVREQIKEGYIGLMRADSALGNHKEALENYKLYIVYRDSLLNEENTKKAVQQQMQYEFDKKEALAKEEQDTRDKIQEAETKKQRIILILVSCFLVLVLGLAVVIFRSLRINQKKNRIIQLQKEAVEHQKELVEEKQKEIIDSINYASRIQRALITSERYIDKSLNRLMK